eukprot:3966556-Alexandrium_andersonii.AAC.1
MGLRALAASDWGLLLFGRSTAGYGRSIRLAGRSNAPAWPAVEQAIGRSTPQGRPMGPWALPPLHPLCFSSKRCMRARYIG